MSRLDVIYHQGYGAHPYLPATSAAAAAVAYKAAYFHRQQQQQRKLCSYSRMQDSVDGGVQARQTQTLPREQDERRGGEEGPQPKETHPAEAEYLSSRCVLFTYFQGDIGDVVDEHFSRALSQTSATRGPARGLWRDGGALASGQCSGFPSALWGGGYPSQASPRLSSLHPEFSPSAAAFQASDPAAWAPEPWPYPLGSQSAGGYAHVHELYPHVHARHAHHHMLHHAHTHSPALDARFGSLLLPGMRPSGSPAPQGEGGRSEPDTATHGWPASFHGSVDVYESALDQEKGKTPVWF
ncbi:hypothetical protein COCON_G00197080 [Conger conger]|uniref:Vestigial n=1 Tax=Conger conger TaxID=82655 RepID=A0A9Q1HQW1_CONCO|nr:hypothetical protein COCON_G00197080 [Conger conger]